MLLHSARSDQGTTVLGGLQVAHAVQRRSEWRQPEEGSPVFRISGSSLRPHSFRGTAEVCLMENIKAGVTFVNYKYF